MSEHTGHIIAVDGGGSTCRVAIATPNGQVIATETGPSANVSTALDAATACILKTVAKAWYSAGLPENTIAQARAFVGLAGVKSPRIANAVAAKFPMKQITVIEDRATTMAGALGDNVGFIAAIGTGSFLGRQTGRAQSFIGGHGLQLGDQASGAWLGRQLLGHVLEWQDGLHAGSDLLETTLASHQNDPNAIIEFAASALPQDFAKLAPTVLNAADKGDAAGTEIIREGADYLQHALTTLGYLPKDRLCLMGGIGARYAPYLNPDYTQNITAPLGSALDGAIRLAMAQSRRG